MSNDQKLKVRGIQRTHINLKAHTNLSGKEIRILLEKGAKLFAMLKKLALSAKDKEVIDYLKNNKDLLEVLAKWEQEEGSE